MATIKSQTFTINYIFWTDSGQISNGTMGRSKDITYQEYLSLDTILDSQNLLTESHDEVLFIIQHQTTELWMKLLIHELNLARASIRAGELKITNKILARISRIFALLNHAWDVLRTLTPSEYTKFRDALGTSSGFYSFQYRMIEFILGNRDVCALQSHKKIEWHHTALEAELSRPSLYECSIDRLYTVLDNGTSSAPALQLTQQRQLVKEVQDRWKIVYEESEKFWELYALAEKLVDLEDYFRRWRFNHVTTVERVIGDKTGTGGSSGVRFLRKRLDVVLFPELWKVRGDL